MVSPPQAASSRTQSRNQPCLSHLWLGVIAGPLHRVPRLCRQPYPRDGGPGSCAESRWQTLNAKPVIGEEEYVLSSGATEPVE
jgi:hypothetical protein